MSWEHSNIALFFMVMAVVGVVVAISYTSMYFLNKAVNQGNNKKS